MQPAATASSLAASSTGSAAALQPLPSPPAPPAEAMPCRTAVCEALGSANGSSVVSASSMGRSSPAAWLLPPAAQSTHVSCTSVIESVSGKPRESTPLCSVSSSAVSSNVPLTDASPGSAMMSSAGAASRSRREASTAAGTVKAIASGAMMSYAASCGKPRRIVRLLST